MCYASRNTSTHPTPSSPLSFEMNPAPLLRTAFPAIHSNYTSVPVLGRMHFYFLCGENTGCTFCLSHNESSRSVVTHLTKKRNKKLASSSCSLLPVSPPSNTPTHAFVVARDVPAIPYLSLLSYPLSDQGLFIGLLTGNGCLNTAKMIPDWWSRNAQWISPVHHFNWFSYGFVWEVASTLVYRLLFWKVFKD